MNKLDQLVNILADAYREQCFQKESLFARRISEHIAYFFLYETKSEYIYDDQKRVIDVMDTDESYNLFDYQTVGDFLEEPTYFDPLNPDEMPSSVFYWLDAVKYKFDEGIFYFALEYMELNETLAIEFKEVVDGFIQSPEAYTEFYEARLIPYIEDELMEPITALAADILDQTFPFFIRKHTKGADVLAQEIDHESNLRENLNNHLSVNKKKYNDSVSRRLKLLGSASIHYVESQKNELKGVLDKLLKDASLSLEAILCAILCDVILIDAPLKEAVIDDISIKILFDDSDDNWYF